MKYKILQSEAENICTVCGKWINRPVQVGLNPKLKEKPTYDEFVESM